MEPLTVRLLDRDYRVACEPSERDTLLAAALHLNAAMLTIRGQGKVASPERIAVLAALNIAAELMAARTAKTEDRPTPVAAQPDRPEAAEPSDPALLRRVQEINALLDTALANQERLF